MGGPLVWLHICVFIPRLTTQSMRPSGILVGPLTVYTHVEAMISECRYSEISFRCR